MTTELMEGVFAHGQRESFINDALKFGRSQEKEARLLSYNEAPELFDEMRAAIPVEGEEIFQIFSVVVHPGRQIKEHEHTEWVALFYPEPAETPLCVKGGEWGLLMRPGELVVIAPGVPHAVPRNESGRPRQSIAMKVIP